MRCMCQSRGQEVLRAGSASELESKWLVKRKEERKIDLSYDMWRVLVTVCTHGTLVLMVLGIMRTEGVRVS